MSANQITELKTTIAALESRIAALEVTPKTKTTKAKKEKKEGAEPRVASEGVQKWKATVEQTVADMRANGWESWTDVSGNVFAGSKPATIDGRATHVFADTGKEPAYPIGLKRASFLKTKDSPEELAKTKARADKRAETVAAKKGTKVEAVGDGAPAAEKPKRVLTEEHKAKMQAGRKKTAAAKKGEAAPAAPAETAEAAPVEEAKEPVVAKPAAKKVVVAKKAKVYDLSFNSWTFNGEDYIQNERGDTLTMEGDWVGRFNGKVIDETVERPTDIDEFLTLE
jgi:hypothetical protein